MLDAKTKCEIRKLRSSGLSYLDICEKVGVNVPKSTLSYICKGVKLPEGYLLSQREKMIARLGVARKQALIVNRSKLNDRMAHIHTKATSVVQSKSFEDCEKVHLAMLYIAEGSKYKSYRGLALGSSDVAILQIYMGLLMKYYGKRTSDFRARVQWRADQDLGILQAYWSENLGLPLTAFYRSSPDQRTLGKVTKKEDYKGVCVVSCSGADIQLELDMIARVYGENIKGH